MTCQGERATTKAKYQSERAEVQRYQEPNSKDGSHKENGKDDKAGYDSAKQSP